tara:strand:- start:419 stop:1093 length:675 start_codon:yes stop_codon:yes gene_type:complete
MPQQKSKRILIYFFLFLIIGTFNNKDLNNINFAKINEIVVTGLDKKDNLYLIRKLSFLKINNLFFLDERRIEEILNSNNLVENYSVFKKYPSTLNIKIEKAEILAQVKRENKIFFLGSNGKLISNLDIENDVPFIFGNFENKNFFELRNAIQETNFDYSKIKNLYFFKSGRWDIETNEGLLIKLPKENLKKKLKFLIIFLEKDFENKIDKIDLRQYNQVIVNGR